MISSLRRLWHCLAVTLLAATVSGESATAQTDSVVCKACVIDSVHLDSLLVRSDTMITHIYQPTADTFPKPLRDSIIKVFPPPPVSGLPTDCRNAPAGFRVVTIEHFNTMVPTYQAGRSYPGFYRRGGNITVSNGEAIGVFPQGRPGGSAPFRMDVDFPKSPAVYFCLREYLDPLFTNNGNAGTKFGFFLTPYEGTSKYVNHYYNLYSKLGVNLQSAGATLNKNYPAKGNSPVGRYAVVEVLVDGAAGTAQIWVDNVLVLDAKNITFFFPGQAPAFDGLTWNPTYGGGRNPIPYTMVQLMDYWAVLVR
jgi:hypothetical protein